jgi:hypothetical protein
MRILFFSKLLTLPPFVDLLLELAARDAEVVVALSTNERERAVDPRLLAAPSVRFERYEEFTDESAARSAELLRRARDYCWYLAPEHAVASFNRRRALNRFTEVAFGRTRAPASWRDPLLALKPERQAALDELLAGLERQLQPDPGIVSLIESHRPDAVLVTPLIRPRLHQTDVVKAARVLGVPSGFLVYSWDSLSNKGRVHAEPDRTYVWNDVHRREAIELHGLDPEGIVVVGAAQWDAFFALRPSEGREEFCARHGLDPARPIVLYLASTTTVCPDEIPVIERWLDALRGGPREIRDANVLVRRHPGISGWPRSWSQRVPRGPGVSVSDAPTKGGQTLFDDLYHAAVVVALNTSAQIEASILEKPVYTFSAGDLAPGQEGTLHFYNLLEGHGGVVRFSDTLDDHVAQLASGVAGGYDREAIRRFCESRVRPLGLGRAVSPILADEIVQLASAPAAGALRAATGRQGRSRRSVSSRPPLPSPPRTASS